MNIVVSEARNGSLKGVIVQLGGQTPLKIAKSLQSKGIKILGTSPAEIDNSEDRYLFKKLLKNLRLRQPTNTIANNREEALHNADKVGFPLVIRPSYVLGGRAMEVIFNERQLENYIGKAIHISGQNPVLLDSYLQNAIELDVDAVSTRRCMGRWTWNI